MTIQKKSIWLMLVFGLLVLSFVTAGCGETATTKNPVAPTAAAAPANPTILPVSDAKTTPSANPAIVELTGTITTSGSTTVQPLAEKLANAFMAANPKVKIIVQGGGTSVGIKAVDQGTVDIGAASRELTSSEPALKIFTLARDGIAIIVHPSNPVNDLTRSQIVDIFSGKITNWKEVGGPDKTIHVVAREEGSGTRTAFQEMVMGKETIAKNAILQSSSGAIAQVVKRNSQAISFDSFGYVDNTLKALSVDGVAATVENAKNGKYPIVRPLNFLTKNEPTGVVKAFLDFCQSDAAQKIISGEGYVTEK